jgi:hypothetical protein
VHFRQTESERKSNPIETMVDITQYGRPSVKSSIKEYQQSHREVFSIASTRSRNGMSGGRMLPCDDDTHKSTDLE